MSKDAILSHLCFSSAQHAVVTPCRAASWVGDSKWKCSHPPLNSGLCWTWACRTNVGGQVLRTWCLGHTARVSDSPRLIFLLRSLRPRTTPCSPARRQRAVASHGASRVFWRWMSRIPPCKFSCSGEGRWAVLSFRIERGLQRVSLKRTLSPRQHSHFSLDV